MTEIESLKKSVQLAELVHNGETPDIVAPIFPGLGCGFFAVSFIVPLITRSSAVMIAPALCSYNARLIMSRFEQSSLLLENNLIFLLYEEDDIIHGAADKIKQSLIDFYNRKNPDLLFVVTSCLPEIVGEDIEAVVQEVREIIKSPVLVIRTENFTNISSMQGVERTFASLIDIMEPPSNQEDKLVNIIGFSAYKSRNSELERILTSAGFTINSTIPSFGDISGIKQATNARFNIILDRGCTLLAQKMKEIYNIDYVLFDQAYYPETIYSEYDKIGDLLSTDLSSIIRPLYEDCSEYISAKKKSQGKETCIISLGNGRVFDLAHLLFTMGYNIPVLALDELSDQDRQDASALYSKGCNPEIIRNASCYPLEEYMSRIKPDYYLTYAGYEQKMCTLHKIRYRNLYPYNYTNGFERSKQVLQDIFSENPGEFNHVEGF